MEIWLIEPHDPLIVRDGKPFGPNSGARASTLMPSRMLCKDATWRKKLISDA